MKNNQRGFGMLEVFFVILIAGLIGGAGWFVYRHNSDSTISKTNFKTVLGHKISQTDCSSLKSKLQKLGGVDGDICYSGPISANGETFEYVIVDQSESYQENIRQDYKRDCTLDCGGGIPITGPSDYIIRANGQAENASVAWTGSADMALEALTGCPLPDIDNYADSGKFVVDNDRVGISFSGKNINLGGRYGSSCKASFDLIAYTSLNKPNISFRSVAVQYSLKDPSSCASKDVNDSNANSDAEQCYSDQAGMRGNITICDKTYFSGTGTDSSECIHAVAERNRDPSICKLTYKNDQAQCMDLADTAKSYFSGTIKATGL